MLTLCYASPNNTNNSFFYQILTVSYPLPPPQTIMPASYHPVAAAEGSKSAAVHLELSHLCCLSADCPLGGSRESAGLRPAPSYSEPAQNRIHINDPKYKHVSALRQTCLIGLKKNQQLCVRVNHFNSCTFTVSLKQLQTHPGFIRFIHV